MTRRRLTAEEQALWARVAASARALDPSRPTVPAMNAEPGRPPVRPVISLPQPIVPNRRAATPPRPPGTTLDRSWDRRLARGMVSPDSAIDLHGHSLASAHGVLDAGIDRALARGDRVLLVVTGKPPRAEAERPFARGAIRAAIGDWIAGSRHADRIAAVRGAHPRHGGTGALYIILRRARGMDGAGGP